MDDMTKYEMIVEDIKKKIDAQEYTDNQVIPSEMELCEMYSVSRITVRRAIECLISEGVLYRIGRKGCFVRGTDHTEKNMLSHIYSFTEAIQRQGKKPSKKQLSLELQKAGSVYANELKIDEEDNVYVLKSLYMANGIPYSYNISALPADMFPKLEYFDFNNRSLYEVLRTFYGLKISRATQQLAAVTGTDDIVSLLQIEKQHPILRIEATSFSSDDSSERPFEAYKAWMLTDVLSYYVEKFN